MGGLVAAIEDHFLVPEFAQLAEALAILLRDTTERIIQKSVFGNNNGELGETEAMTG